jgi:hypothetical protein
MISSYSILRSSVLIFIDCRQIGMPILKNTLEKERTENISIMAKNQELTQRIQANKNKPPFIFINMVSKG